MLLMGWDWKKWEDLSLYCIFITGYPSILVPQLVSSNNTDIVMDNHSKGWVVSLDYGTTAIIALVSGQFQASHGLCFLCFVWSYCKRRDHLIQQKKSQGWLKKRGSCLGLFGPSYGVFGLWNQKCRQNPSLILLDDRWCSDLRRRVWWPASPSLWPGYWWPTPTISTPSTPAGQWWRWRKTLTPYWMFRMLTGLGNGILTSSVYIVEVVAASRRGSVVMVRQPFFFIFLQGV